ncbi:hypothetical protein PG993_011835, partial [Apiospora rasikravindrae]
VIASGDLNPSLCHVNESRTTGLAVSILYISATFFTMDNTSSSGSLVRTFDHRDSFSASNNRYIALKVLVAASKSAKELQILHRLAQVTPKRTTQCTAPLLDSF